MWSESEQRSVLPPPRTLRYHAETDTATLTGAGRFQSACANMLETGLYTRSDRWSFILKAGKRAE